MKPALLCWLIPPAVARHLAALDLSLVPVAPATDLTAESAEQEEDRSNDQEDKTDRPERRTPRTNPMISKINPRTTTSDLQVRAAVPPSRPEPYPAGRRLRTCLVRRSACLRADRS